MQETLIESQIYNLFQTGEYWTNSLAEDVAVLQKAKKINNYKIFGSRNNDLIYNSFLKSGQVFFPQQDDWKDYVSLTTEGRDILLIKHFFKDKNITWVQPDPEIRNVYSEIKENCNEFVETYRKLISTIPQKETSYSKVNLKTWYRNMKENFTDYSNQRRSVNHSSFLAFMLGTLSCQLKENNNQISSLNNFAFWNQKVDDIVEWSKKLQDVKLTSRGIHQIPLRNKSFIFADANTIQIDEKKFYNQCVSLSEKGHYLAIICEKNSPIHRFFSKKKTWKMNKIDESRFIVTNYNLNGLSPQPLREETSYTSSYAEAYTKYMRGLI